MVHIGNFTWKRTLNAGQFYCSRCLAISQYRHRWAMPFLTIYFIPVIPIGGSSTFIECSTCQTQYPESIILPGLSTGNFGDDLLHAVCLTILADGVVDADEVDRGIVVLRALGHALYTQKEIMDCCAIVRNEYRSLGEFLWRSRYRWMEEGKMRIIQAVFLVASWKGHISKNRLKPLADAGTILGIARSQIEQYIIQAEQVNLD